MISVLIPVGNGREKNLNLCLYALTRQTFRDFEVVIVTDAKEPHGVLDTCIQYNDALDVRCYVNKSAYTASPGAINRNMAAARADYPFLVFIDSDVLLHPQALAYYMDDFDAFPNRAILGPCHRLPPMTVQKEELEHWESLWLIPSLVRDEPLQRWGLDPRWECFQKTSPRRLYCDYGRAAHLWPINMGISRECFDHVGGFWERLPRQAELAFGLSFMQAGFSWSYDARIMALHLYHEREEMNGEDPAPLIKQRFHSDQSWLGRMSSENAWPWMD